jgi:hypothetical protein
MVEDALERAESADDVPDGDLTTPVKVTRGPAPPERAGRKRSPHQTEALGSAC